MGARNQKLIFKKPRKAFRFHYPEGRGCCKMEEFSGKLNIDSKIGNAEISCAVVISWTKRHFLLFNVVKVMFFRDVTRVVRQAMKNCIVARIMEPFGTNFANETACLHSSPSPVSNLGEAQPDTSLVKLFVDIFQRVDGRSVD